MGNLFYFFNFKIDVLWNKVCDMLMLVKVFLIIIEKNKISMVIWVLVY